MKRGNIVIVAGLLCAIFIACGTAADSVTDLQRLKNEYTRGIAIGGKPSEPKTPSAASGKLGVEYHILTDAPEAVSSAHRFRSGDRFKLQFRVNQDSYVYVLNRTVAGSSLSRGIDVEPASKARAYKLLHPRGKPDSNRVGGDRTVVLPPDDYFQMDQTPGEEKVIILVTRNPIDIGKYFNIETGDYSPAVRSDSGGDIEGQLNRDLHLWSENAEFAEAPNSSDSRGIQVDRVESVGIARDSQKPMVLVLDLNHLPN